MSYTRNARAHADDASLDGLFLIKEFIYLDFYNECKQNIETSLAWYEILSQNLMYLDYTAAMLKRQKDPKR